MDFELAVRDIFPGEELTSDYATLNLLPHESFACSCSSPQCRRKIASSDPTQMAARWVTLLRDALQVVKEIPQPLWVLMRQEYIDKACCQIGVGNNFAKALPAIR